MADPREWLLTAARRGNPATGLDDRHEDGVAWSTGSLVQPPHTATTSPNCVTELCCAVLDDTLDQRDPLTAGNDGHRARVCARQLRLLLAREHLNRAAGED